MKICIDCHLQTTFQHAKKADRVKETFHPSNKAGTKTGHIGASSTRKSNRIKIHKPKKCAKCDDKNITVTKTTTKRIMDIPYIPEIESTNNVI